MTYELMTVAGVTAIRCLLCYRISELASDVAQRYCSRCHMFLDVVAEARAAHAEGATHDCGEWHTYRQLCAVCGAGTPTTDMQLVEDMVAEMLTRETPIEMVLRPASAFQLASLLQLALRHPAVSEDVRRIGWTFIAHVRAYFADAPAISETLRRGDDPTTFDVKVTASPPPPNLYDVLTLALRVRYRVLGGHVHCRVFTAPMIEETFVKAGELTFTVEEWPALFALLKPFAEFQPEDD